MDASMMSQMKALEDENRRLKRMYADLSMQADLLKEALEKNEAAISAPRAGRESSGATRRECRAGMQDSWRQRNLFSV